MANANYFNSRKVNYFGAVLSYKKFISFLITLSLPKYDVSMVNELSTLNSLKKTILAEFSLDLLIENEHYSNLNILLYLSISIGNTLQDISSFGVLQA